MSVSCLANQIAPLCRSIYKGQSISRSIHCQPKNHSIEMKPLYLVISILLAGLNAISALPAQDAVSEAERQKMTGYVQSEKQNFVNSMQNIIDTRPGLAPSDKQILKSSVEKCSVNDCIGGSCTLPAVSAAATSVPVAAIAAGPIISGPIISAANQNPIPAVPPAPVLVPQAVNAQTVTITVQAPLPFATPTTSISVLSNGQFATPAAVILPSIITIVMPQQQAQQTTTVVAAKPLVSTIFAAAPAVVAPATSSEICYKPTAAAGQVTTQSLTLTAFCQGASCPKVTPLAATASSGNNSFVPSTTTKLANSSPAGADTNGNNNAPSSGDYLNGGSTNSTTSNVNSIPIGDFLGGGSALPSNATQSSISRASTTNTPASGNTGSSNINTIPMGDLFGSGSSVPPNSIGIDSINSDNTSASIVSTSTTFNSESTAVSSLFTTITITPAPVLIFDCVGGNCNDNGSATMTFANAAYQPRPTMVNIPNYVPGYNWESPVNTVTTTTVTVITVNANPSFSSEKCSMECSDNFVFHPPKGPINPIIPVYNGTNVRPIGTVPSVPTANVIVINNSTSVTTTEQCSGDCAADIFRPPTWRPIPATNITTVVIVANKPSLNFTFEQCAVECTNDIMFRPPLRQPIITTAGSNTTTVLVINNPSNTTVTETCEIDCYADIFRPPARIPISVPSGVSNTTTVVSVTDTTVISGGSCSYGGCQNSPSPSRITLDPPHVVIVSRPPAVLEDCHASCCESTIISSGSQCDKCSKQDIYAVIKQDPQTIVYNVRDIDINAAIAAEAQAAALQDARFAVEKMNTKSTSYALKPEKAEYCPNNGM